jgi:hypothetical protein
MNPNFLDAFWLAMPPIMKLLVGVFLGATVHFVRNRALPIAEGLAGAFTSVVAGLLITIALCYVKHLNYGELWFVGAGLAFLANYFLGGMETLGKQIRDSPVKFLIETILDSYDAVKERLKPKS